MGALGPMCFYGNDPEAKIDEQAYQAQVAALSAWLDWADAVVVGAGSGMSSAGGCNHYHRDETFAQNFATFEERHGFHSLMDGYYHLYSSNEEEWAYLASYIAFMLDEPTSEPYRNLAKLLAGKPHFVLTTNVDTQVPKAFDEGRVFTFQGDFRFLQCCQPCTDELFDAEPIARKIVSSLDEELRCPPDLLPRCPRCHRIMRPWVRDDTFLEGPVWLEARECYERFLREHLLADERVLFLELGVGDMTPAIIKMPFWQMTANNPNARFCSVNMSKVAAAEQLGERGFAVVGDIARVLREAPIGAVFTTGATATRLYRKLCEPACSMPCTGLPSTSPANAAWSLPRLVEAYRPIREAADLD
jgi:NAD-dependent SIR2 family protein deacetylase